MNSGKYATSIICLYVKDVYEVFMHNIRMSGSVAFASTARTVAKAMKLTSNGFSNPFV